MDELDDPDLDGEPALLDDLPIIIALLAGAIAMFCVLYLNWPTTPRSPSSQEPSVSEEDANSSEADKPEYFLFGDSSNSDEYEMDVDFPEDEEYYMVNIDHGLMQFNKIEDQKEQERLHAVIEHEVRSSDEGDSNKDLDLTPEEFQESAIKFQRVQTSLMKRSVEDAVDKKKQQPHPTATGIQKPCDVDAVKKGYVEEAEQEREVGDTTTVPTSKSLERTVKTITSDESREDTSKEKDRLESGRDEVPLTEWAATEASSDESIEDLTAMEKKKRRRSTLGEAPKRLWKRKKSRVHATSQDSVDTVTSTVPITESVDMKSTEIRSDEIRDASSMTKGYFDEELERFEDEGTSTEATVTKLSPGKTEICSDESREDAIPMAKDNLDIDQERKSSQIRAGDAESAISDGEDQNCENDEVEENCDEDQIQNSQQERTSETELRYPRRRSKFEEFEEPLDVGASKQSNVKEIEQETSSGGRREDVSPVEYESARAESEVDTSSNLDQGTVLLSDSYDEISAADVLKRIKIERQISIKEGDTPTPQESLHAEREDADTTTVLTSISGETIVRKISSHESTEDASMEKDTIDEEHEVGENDVTSVEETATGMSSDETGPETELRYPRRHSKFEEPLDVDVSKQSNVKEIEQETSSGGSREDVSPVEYESARAESEVDMSSNLDQGTVLLSDSYDEISAADVLKRIKIERQVSIKEGDTPTPQESLHAESEDADTTTVLTSTSGETIVTKISSHESTEDASMEKDTIDENHEVGENQFTSVEEIATGMSSDETGERASAMEKDTFDEEHVSENQVTSVEETATETSSGETGEDAFTMEKDTLAEEHESVDEVTSVEETVTGLSSDETGGDAPTMEKDALDEEHESVDEVTSTEEKDVIPKANDDIDLNQEDAGAKPEYVRVSSSVMERRASEFSPGDDDSTTSDTGEVMISGSSTEVAPCATSTMDANESPSEDQTSRTNEDDENWGEEQFLKESSQVEYTQEEQNKQDVTTLPAEDDDDECED